MHDAMQGMLGGGTEGFLFKWTQSDESSKWNFFVKEKDGIISELLLVVGGEDNALISILGDIDLKEAHRIAKEIHGDHMGHFSKLKDVEF